MGKWIKKERPTQTDKLTKKPYGTIILTDGSLDYTYKGPIGLNRSKRWTYAATYDEARLQEHIKE